MAEAWAAKYEERPKKKRKKKKVEVVCSPVVDAQQCADAVYIAQVEDEESK